MWRHLVCFSSFPFLYFGVQVPSFATRWQIHSTLKSREENIKILTIKEQLSCNEEEQNLYFFGLNNTNETALLQEALYFNNQSK